MSALLAVRGLTRHFAGRAGNGLFRKPVTVRAVDGVSFDLMPGRTLGLVGESGCGKTTTARLVLGLMQATAGTVEFDGAAMPPPATQAWRDLRRRVQMVFQDPLGALDRRIPVLAQIAEPLAIHGTLKRGEREAKARALMDDVGLPPHLASRYPHELSGGQRQRVVLARALITGPDLLVCDEPVSALDVSVAAQVINLLEDLQARHGVAMLFISHDLKVVRQVAHEVAVMYLGRIVEQGAPDAVFSDPAHPYAQALVSAIPHPLHPNRKRIVLVGDPPNPSNVPSGCAFHTRCPVAVSACRAEVPKLQPRADGRLVACHLAHAEATRPRMLEHA
jgi:peptide/nickel transport system ATP-binding protein